jgi:hypothetical protein
MVIGYLVRSHGRDREMDLLKRLFNSMGYVLRTDIADGQRQIQRLKGRIEDLSQRLRSIETMSAAVVVELSGVQGDTNPDLPADR